MATLLPNVRLQYLDANGAPLAGGKLYTYAAGTSTPQATFTDESEGAQNTNPVILDANGMASVWISGLSYKLRLTDSSDVDQWTYDDVSAIETGAVIASKIADGAVTTAKIGSKQVTTANIADQAVDTGQLKDAAVTTAKIGSKQVATASIADQAVDTLQLKDGSVLAAKIGTGQITQVKMGAVGQQKSSSSGTFSTSSTTFVDITNLTISITTSGRPVLLMLVADTTTVLNGIGISASTGNGVAVLKLVRSLLGTPTDVSIFKIGAQNLAGDSIFADVPPGSVLFLDPVAAGIYTYKLQGLLSSGSGTNTLAVTNCYLVAFEL